MEISTLSSDIFVYMTLSYFQKSKASFFISTFTSKYSAINDNVVCDALVNLEKDELVSIFYKDNSPYIITLRPHNIRKMDTETLSKKGYTLAKDVFNFCHKG